MLKAKELMMIGDWFTPEEALSMGLCNKVVPDADLLPTAKALAIRMAKMNQTSIRMSKELLHKPFLDVLDKGGLMDLESK